MALADKFIKLKEALDRLDGTTVIINKVIDIDDLAEKLADKQKRDFDRS